MKNTLLIITCFAGLWLHAQNSIKGFVLDATDKAPVAGSSVFITNTSLGTISDKSGYFEINNIPPGNYELVTSNISYETAAYSFSTDKNLIQVRFLIHPKTEEMETVVVGGYVTETWKKWGRTFLEYFIGLNDNSKRTELKNKKVLQFRFYKKQNRLKVIAREPLIIENKALGYKLIYDMQDFEINFNDHSTFYAGYTLFSELSGRKSDVVKWRKSREETFRGSLMNFFRATYNKRLNEEGFEAYRMKRIPNLEKMRIRQLYKQRVTNNVTNGERIITIPQFDNDSNYYYEKVLSQPDFTEKYEPGVLTADSIISGINGSGKILSWADYIAITFKNNTEEQSYLTYYNQKRKPAYPHSLLHLTADSIVIDANGNWNPVAGLISEWYWSWTEKISDMLPINYEPGK